MNETSILLVINLCWLPNQLEMDVLSCVIRFYKLLVSFICHNVLTWKMLKLKNKQFLQSKCKSSKKKIKIPWKSKETLFLFYLNCLIDSLFHLFESSFRVELRTPICNLKSMIDSGKIYNISHWCRKKEKINVCWFE